MIDRTDDSQPNDGVPSKAPMGRIPSSTAAGSSVMVSLAVDVIPPNDDVPAHPCIPTLWVAVIVGEKKSVR